MRREQIRPPLIQTTHCVLWLFIHDLSSTLMLMGLQGVLPEEHSSVMDPALHDYCLVAQIHYGSGWLTLFALVVP